MMLKWLPSAGGRQRQQLPGQPRRRSSGRSLRGMPAHKRSAPVTAPVWRSAQLFSEAALLGTGARVCCGSKEFSHPRQRCNGSSAQLGRI